MAKELGTLPIFAPGQGMSELARSAFRIARGPDIASAVGVATGTTTTLPLFKVPANTFVKEIILDIQNKWATSSRQAFKVGDTGDDDRFFTATGVAPWTAVAVKTSATAPTVNAGGRFYSAAQTINAIRTCGTKNTATGHIHTYIIYAPNIDYIDIAST